MAGLLSNPAVTYCCRLGII